MIYDSSYFPSPENGFTGWSFDNLANNFWSSYNDGYTWFRIFGIFFPTITGVLSGINMSGDLRAPSTDIPNGTLAAFGTSSVLYFNGKSEQTNHHEINSNVYFSFVIQNILIFGVCTVFGCNMWPTIFILWLFDCTKSVRFEHSIIGWCLCIKHLFVLRCNVWNAKVIFLFNIFIESHPFYQGAIRLKFMTMMFYRVFFCLQSFTKYCIGKCNSGDWNFG